MSCQTTEVWIRSTLRSTERRVKVSARALMLQPLRLIDTMRRRSVGGGQWGSITPWLQLSGSLSGSLRHATVPPSLNLSCLTVWANDTHRRVQTRHHSVYRPSYFDGGLETEILSPSTDTACSYWQDIYRVGAAAGVPGFSGGAISCCYKTNVNTSCNLAQALWVPHCQTGMKGNENKKWDLLGLLSYWAKTKDVQNKSSMNTMRS